MEEFSASLIQIHMGKTVVAQSLVVVIIADLDTLTTDVLVEDQETAIRKVVMVEEQGHL